MAGTVDFITPLAFTLAVLTLSLGLYGVMHLVFGWLYDRGFL